jgi:hypothetical protein
MTKAAGKQHGIKNMAQPKAKRTSGRRMSASKKSGIEKREGKRIAEDIGRAEKGGVF